MKRVIVVTLVAAAAALSFGRSASSGQNPPIDTGRALFVTYCASCHGVNASGDGPMAGQLRSRPSNLTQYTVNNRGVFPSERLHRIIDGKDASVRSHGSMEMPVWGDAFRQREGLSREAAAARIDAIVRYLDVIQERRAH